MFHFDTIYVYMSYIHSTLVSLNSSNMALVYSGNLFN